MLDDIARELLFSVLSQLSDHCVYSRKLIAYKIIKMWKYISGVSKVVEEKKKEKVLKATCDQSKEYEKSESRTRKFSTKWQVGRPWLKNGEELERHDLRVACCQQTNFDSQSNVIKLTYAQKKKPSKRNPAAAASLNSTPEG